MTKKERIYKLMANPSRHIPTAIKEVQDAFQEYDHESFEEGIASMQTTKELAEKTEALHEHVQTLYELAELYYEEK